MIVGSSVVAALEDCWATIQTFHPSVPDVTISLAFVKRTFAVTYRRHVIVTFDALKAGPEVVVASLLHEAVHHDLKERGARDWHRHLGTFRDHAARFGLVDDGHPRFGAIDLSAAAEARYLLHIHALDRLLLEAA